MTFFIQHAIFDEILDDRFQILCRSSSPDLNPAEEDLGAIIKDRVEVRMLNEEGHGRYSHQTSLSNLQTALHDLEHDTILIFCNFELLVRLDAVVVAAGGHMDY